LISYELDYKHTQFNIKSIQVYATAKAIGPGKVPSVCGIGGLRMHLPMELVRGKVSNIYVIKKIVYFYICII
jgi:hypothetical protein